MAKFLVALIQVKSVNLSEVASVFAGSAEPASHDKRAQRFLRFFELSYASVAALVLKLLKVPAPWVLTMDRTDWYLGQTPLNILVLGVADKATAFPLLWMILEKKGCSNTAERCALLAEFGRLFGFSAIAYLCADREFIGKDWFSYLRRKAIPCRIRVRANTKIANARRTPGASPSVVPAWSGQSPSGALGGASHLGARLVCQRNALAKRRILDRCRRA